MKRFLPILLILIGWSLAPSAHAQRGTVRPEPEASKWYRSGEKALLERDYKKAIRAFEKAIRVQSNLSPAHRGIGACYTLLNQYEKALHHYEKTLELDSMFSRALYYQIGEVHYKLGQHERALEYFNKFRQLQELPADKFGLNGKEERAIEEEYLAKLESTIRGVHISRDSSQFTNISNIVNLGKRINSAADEYFPFLTNDQSLIFYTRRKGVGHDENLYYSRYENGDWKSGSQVSKFNTSENEGMSTLVRDGKHMFFTACNREGVYGTCDIWEAIVEGEKITKVSSLEGYSNSGAWESQAAISCDGRTLFFASNREGGMGGTDLWYSQRQADGKWSDPVNLGPRINTADDEESPFISNDGQTLYFTSTGHLGLGGQDIFMSRKTLNGHWSTPINLGPPVNTPHRELGFFLSADGKTGYFASDRPGGQGGMDIYKFQLSEQLHSDPITFVEGFVRDSVRQMNLLSTVEFEKRGGIRTDENGRFFLCIPAGDTLHVSVKLPDYRPYENTFIIPRWDNRQFYTIELLLDPILQLTKRGAAEEAAPVMSKPKKMVKKQYNCTLFFTFDSYKLDMEQMNRLDEFMQRFENKEIQNVSIIGYSDDIGADAYNLKLSEKRAKHIALFMREYGVIVNKIYMEGRGEIKDDSPKGKNRKVDIRVVSLEEARK